MSPSPIRGRLGARRWRPERIGSIARPTLSLGLILTAMSVVACSDATSPQSLDQQLEPSSRSAKTTFPSLSDYAAIASPEAASGSVDVINMGTTSNSVVMGYYPTTTVVTLSMTGGATSSGITPIGSVGVKGIGDSCGSSNPWMSWDGNSYAACAYGPTITIAVHGILRLNLQSFANGLAPSNSAPCYGGAFSGDRTSTTPCTIWSGSFSGTAERLPAELVLEPQDTTIKPGGAANLRLSASPARLGGFWDNPTPMEPVTAWYVPDPDSSGGVQADSLISCRPFSGPQVCRIAPQGSGTFHIIELINGALKEKSAHILVSRPKITLSLSADSVGTGDTVLVTTVVSNAEKEPTLTYSVTTVPFPLASRAPSGRTGLASRASVGASVRLRSPADLRPLHSTGAGGAPPCLSTPGPKQCYVVATEQGLLKVSVSTVADGYPLGATQSCTVKDCKMFKDESSLPDDFLKDGKVQDMLKDLAKKTKWNEPLEKQGEVGGFIVQDKDGVRSFKPYDGGVPRNICSSGASANQVANIKAQGYTILAEVHTHPNYGSTNGVQDKNGVQCLVLGDDGKTFVKKPYYNDVLKFWALDTGPSSFDTEDWRKESGYPSYPGLVLEPGKLYRVSHDANGDNAPVPDYPLNDCVGK